MRISPTNAPSTYSRIYALVRRIPRGRVATYGQIAELAGLPGRARQVGYAMSAVTDPTVPWHRVINAQGRVSKRREPGGDLIQRAVLEDEGILFDEDGRIDLEQFRWRPAKSTRGFRTP